jgi:RND family efflux transporter MFP subunit
MSDLKDELAALRIEREPYRPRSGRWVRWVVMLAVIAAAGAGVWWWLTRERPIDVETAAVTTRAAGTQAAVLNASGYVTARRRATVSSKITGKVVEVNVEEGMAVKEGQVLARLDDVTLRASLALSQAQAEAARRALREIEVRLEEAKVQLRRRAQLFKEGIITAAEFDTAEAEVASLEARLAAAREQISVAESQIALVRTNLEDTVIRAPFSGVAISKDAQPGEMVSPVSAGGGFTRTGISTIVDMASLEIEVDVNESYINRVRPGQPVTAVLNAYPEWAIPGRVITTIPAADRQKATVLVRIAFDQLDPRILPDMGVKVTFLREADDTDHGDAVRNVALVPKGAVSTEGEQTYVFVVQGDVVDRRAVRVGGTDGDRLEVLAGLQSGERVVVSPPAELTSGAQVTVR